MASMREIRTRIKSIQDTMQITRAMNLIASAKLKKARRQLSDTKPYFEKIQSTIIDIVEHSPDIEHRFFCADHDCEVKKTAYLVITADKGLCGAYNHNVIRLAEDHMKEKDEIFLLIIGHMGRNYFTSKKYNIDVEFMYTAQDPNVYRAREIADSLVDIYRQGLVDEIFVVYTKMESAVKQEPKVMQVLPLEKSIFGPESGKEQPFKEMMEYTPSPHAVLDTLVPNYVKGMIFGALVESFCSEQCARMTSMDAATSSAQAMVKELTLLYNRARQAAITQEISEIVGGAEALK